MIVRYLNLSRLILMQRAMYVALFVIVALVGTAAAIRRFSLCLVPRQKQQRLLQKVLARNSGTEFGIAHGFNPNDGYAEYTRCIQINDYEYYRQWIDRSIEAGRNLMAKADIYRVSSTSGTTGHPKKILQSKSLFRRDYFEYTLAVLFRILLADPKSLFRPLGVVSASSEAVSVGQLQGGNSANVLYRTSPFRRLAALPPILFDIPASAARYYYFALFITAANCRCLITPNPTTILEILDVSRRKSDEIQEDLLSPVLPNRFNIGSALWRQMLVTWAEVTNKQFRKTKLRAPLSSVKTVVTWTGGSCGFFASRVLERLPGIRLLELGYLATDSPICVPVGARCTQVLAVDRVFAEFIPLDESEEGPLLYHQLVEGHRYEIVLTNRYGLYRYKMNDVIEVKERIFASPTIDFIRKSSSFCNITGEKLSEDQLCSAISKAEDQLSITFEFFIAIPDLEGRSYELFGEFREHAVGVNVDALAMQVDRNLCELNVEYQSKRRDGRLNSLHLNRLNLGAGARYKQTMLARGARDVQFKVRHIQSDACSRGLLMELST